METNGTGRSLRVPSLSRVTPWGRDVFRTDETGRARVSVELPALESGCAIRASLDVRQVLKWRATQKFRHVRPLATRRRKLSPRGCDVPGRLRLPEDRGLHPSVAGRKLVSFALSGCSVHVVGDYVDEAEGVVTRASQTGAAVEQAPSVITRMSPVFTVPDMAEALTFYVSQLEFTLNWRWGEPVTRAAVIRDGFEIQLVCDPDLDGVPPAVVYCHMTGVESYFDACVRRSAPIHQPLTDRPWGMKDFRVRDAAGNQLGFGEADAPETS